ncbi:MAG: M50 family metallopeptidase [bacterium]|nr:M50 family metallopeptidase [bacterium]
MAEEVQSFNRARVVLLVSLVLTAILYIVPYGRVLAYPLMLLSTLAHEMGHGLTALVMGGSFHRFSMWQDGSGVAVWSGDVGRVGRAVIAAGGLVGPAVAAAIGFAAGRTVRGARICLFSIVGILALAELLVVRGLFGWFFVAVVLVGCLLVAAKGSEEVMQLVLVFLAVQLALSVFSRGEYLFTSVAQTATGTMPSDVGHIAAALLLPFWFWGGICGAISVVVLAYGMKIYWR